MNESNDFTAAANPFCSRRIRPGAMPFLFAPGESVQQVVDRLRQADWWGEIVGPHGSGKSSLLAAMLCEIEQAGRPVLLVELHDGQRRLPGEVWRDPQMAKTAVLVIDGYEQLNRWNRHRVKRYCRSHGLGLLVTSHESVGMPTLCRLTPNLALAERIVEQLLVGRESEVCPDAVRESYGRCNGDLREMLFDLYDRHQQGRQA